MSIATSLRRLLTTDPGRESDADLLARFADRRDEAAFTTLLARHGPMVRAVCRRHCPDPHLAADAEQGVWLVLARRAGAVSRPDRLAGWLFGVAVRVGRKVGAGAAPLAPPLAPPVVQDVAVGVLAEELLRVLDEELAALPEAERAPLVLCYLEGRTQDEAARACGTCVRTLRRRLERGRETLRRRLERRGVAPTAALGALVAVPTAASANVLALVLADGPVPSSLSPWIAEELTVSHSAWWARAVLVAGLGTGLVAAAGWARDEKSGMKTTEPPALTPGGADVPPPRRLPDKPPVTARVAYEDQMLVLVNTDGAAAVIFSDPVHRKEDQGVRYRFRYDSADGRTTRTGGGRVFEQYTDGRYDEGKSELDIQAGSIKLRWSAGSPDGGWIYYQPEVVGVHLAHARDFEDHVKELVDSASPEVPKLDLKRYMKK